MRGFVAMVTYTPSVKCQHCHIKGSARGAAAPGPAVFGARNWWEWKMFVLFITGVKPVMMVWTCVVKG